MLQCISFQEMENIFNDKIQQIFHYVYSVNEGFYEIFIVKIQVCEQNWTRQKITIRRQHKVGVCRSEKRWQLTNGLYYGKLEESCWKNYFVLTCTMPKRQRTINNGVRLIKLCSRGHFNQFSKVSRLFDVLTFQNWLKFPAV